MDFVHISAVVARSSGPGCAASPRARRSPTRLRLTGTAARSLRPTSGAHKSLRHEAPGPPGAWRAWRKLLLRVLPAGAQTDRARHRAFGAPAYYDAGYFSFSQWRELPSLDVWIRRCLLGKRRPGQLSRDDVSV